MILALSRITKYRFLIVPLCLIFFMLSIRVTQKACHASEKQKAGKNHLYTASGMNLHHASLYQSPLEPRCTCASSVRTCCMSTNTNRPEDLRVPLIYGGVSSRLSMPQAPIIKLLERTISTQKDIYLHHYSPFQETDSFVFNCTFLI